MWSKYNNQFHSFAYPIFPSSSIEASMAETLYNLYPPIPWLAGMVMKRSKFRHVIIMYEQEITTTRFRFCTIAIIVGLLQLRI